MNCLSDIRTSGDTPIGAKPSIITLLFALAAMLPVTTLAQQQQLDSLMQKFDAYRITSSTEKVYAHLDQDVCLTGETIWFKVYLVNATSHELSDMSKVAYVEVVDNVNHAVIQTKVAVHDGVGSGSVFIPASLSSGNYMFRAYTAWMRNFDPSFYFHKQITVINPFRRLETETKKTAQKTQVQFFPEGGMLVNGMPTRVGFRIVNAPDASAKFSVKIITGDTAVSKADQYGLGTFDFTPQEGQVAAAYLVDEEGHEQALQLPKSQSSGYALSLRDSTADLLVLKIRKVNVHDEEPNLYVVAHARNMISFARVQRVRGGRATVTIPRNTLAEGISHITVFDAGMRPVSERLYFNNVRRILNIKTTQSQREYGVRRKVSLDFAVQDAQGTPSASSLSVAVYRRDSLRNNESNILNSLWLESDLIDPPSLPADFLSTMTPEKSALLDNIMLTHGWRRFSWADVLAARKTQVSIVPELRGHIIRGIVTDAEGTPENGKMTYLSAPGTNIQVYGSVSNKEGKVQFEMKDFSGARRIVVQTNLAKDSTSKVRIMSPYSDQFAPRRISPFVLKPDIAQTLAVRSFAMQVQDIYYQDKGTQSRSVAVDTTAFYGKADATYYLDDYTRFPVMEEIMREYVPGVLVRKRRDGFHFINLDTPNKATFGEDPFIMLDGLPLFDADKIMSYSPLKVRKLEVVTRRYYMGVLSMPGIVSYTTYAGDLSGFNIDPHCLVLDYEGLQLQREYYTPRYDNAKQRESRMPDQRDRLFWSPTLTTDNTGRGHLEFFTSDVTGEYEVLVEGMTKEGSSGAAKSRFMVVDMRD